MFESLLDVIIFVYATEQSNGSLYREHISCLYALQRPFSDISEFVHTST